MVCARQVRAGCVRAYESVSLLVNCVCAGVGSEASAGAICLRATFEHELWCGGYCRLHPYMDEIVSTTHVNVSVVNRDAPVVRERIASGEDGGVLLSAGAGDEPRYETAKGCLIFGVMIVVFLAIAIVLAVMFGDFK